MNICRINEIQVRSEGRPRGWAKFRSFRHELPSSICKAVFYFTAEKCSVLDPVFLDPPIHQSRYTGLKLITQRNSAAKSSYLPSLPFRPRDMLQIVLLIFRTNTRHVHSNGFSQLYFFLMI